MTDMNNTPIQMIALASQTFAEDETVSFVLPTDAFTDVDGDAALTLGATLLGGAVLPDWLVFDAAAGSFSGTPPQDFHGLLSVTVTASDGSLSVSDTFALEITPVNDAPAVGDDIIGQSESEILVGEFAAGGGMTAPGVTELVNGGFVIAWQVGSTTRAAIFDANGVEIVSEFLVSETTDWAGQLDTRITALTNGGFVVNWVSGTDIKARIFDANGVAIGDEFLVNEFTEDDQRFPDITALENGRFVVAWESNDGQQGDESVYAIKARIFDENGVAIGNEFLVNEFTAVDQVDATVITLANGNFMVTWSPSQFPNDGIRAAIFDANGVEVVSEFHVNEDDDTPFSFYGRAATLENGNVIIVWTAHPYYVHAAIFDENGVEVVSSFQVDIDYLDDSPNVAALANGGFVVTSSSVIDGNGTSVSAVIFDENGVEVVSEFVISEFTAGSQFFPLITALANGGFVVTWRSTDGQQSDESNAAMKARIFDENGVAQDVPTILISEDAVTSIDTATLLDNDSDVDGDALTIVSVVATSENGTTLTLNSDGTISYDPTSAQAVQALAVDETLTDTFTYTVSDGNGGESTATVSIVVTGTNDAPIVAIALPDQSSSETVSFALPANAFTDIDSDALTLSATLLSGAALPDWLVFDAAAGSFSGTPPQDFDDTLSVTVTASDGSLSASDTFALEITPVNDAPVGGDDIVSSPRSEFLVNEVTQGDQSQSSVTELSNGNQGGNGNFVVTWVSEGNIMARIFDANGVEIVSEFLANELTDDDQTNPIVRKIEGSTSFVITWESEDVVKARAFDENGIEIGSEYLVGAISNPIVAVWISDDRWAFMDNETGFAHFYESPSSYLGSTVVGNPTAFFDLLPGIANGMFSVGFDEDDLFWVIPGTTAELADGNVVKIWESDGDIKAHIVDANGVVIVSEFLINEFTNNNQTNPIVAAVAGGGFVVTWTSGYGQQGSTIKARIFDENGVTQDVPTIPITEDIVTLIDTASLLANDSDANGDALTIVSVVATSENGATVTLNNAGTISYDPTSAQAVQALAVDETLTDTFTYTVSDGNGGESTAAVSIVVTGTNDAPTVAIALPDQSSVEDEAVSFSLPTNAFTDLDSDGLTLTATLLSGAALPDWLVFDAAAGSFSGTPPQDFNDILNVTVTASDGSLSDRDTFALEIMPVNDGPGGGDDIVSSPRSEFLVNEVTQGDQSDSNVTELSNGNFIITWVSKGDIKARIFDVNGIEIVSEFLVNEVTQGDQSDSRVLSLSNGNFIVTWVSEGDIKARIFDVNGVEIVSEFLVNELTSGDYTNSGFREISYLNPDSDLVIVWEAGGAYKVKAFNGYGVEIGGEYVVYSDPYLMHAAWLDDSDDNYDYGFVYYDPVLGYGEIYSRGGVYIRSIETDDFYSFFPYSVDIDIHLESPQLPGINSGTTAELADGNVVKIWESDGDIKAHIVDANGVVIVSEFLINEFTNNNQTNPIVAAAAGGGFVVTWTSGYGQQGSTIKARIFDENGVAQDVPTIPITEDVVTSIATASLLANDSDADGDALNIVSVVATSENGATVTLNNDGTISYDPTSAQAVQALAVNETLTDTFTYTVSDGNGGESTATVSVVVTGADDAPIVAIALPDQSSAEDEAVSFALPTNAFTDLDSDGLTLTATLLGGAALPNWLVFDAAAGSFSGTPPQDFNDTLSVKVTASDGSLSASDTFALEITPVNDAPGGGDDIVSSPRSEFLVNEVTQGNQSNSSVSEPSNGNLWGNGNSNFVVTWVSEGNIMARIFDANGVEIVSEFLVNELTDGVQTNPIVRKIPVANDFVITWESESGVKARPISANGEVGSEYLVGTSTNPTVAVWVSSYSFAYMNDGDGVAVMYESPGISIGPSVVVDTPTDFFNFLSTANEGDFAFGFSEDELFWVNPGTTAELADGNVVEIWESDGDIKAHIVDANGVVIVSEFLINEFTNSDQTNPIVAAVAGGGFVVTWTSGYGQQGSTIKARIFDENGVAQDVPTIPITEDVVTSIATASLLANDGDADGDALTIVSVVATSENGATVTLNNDGTISYDPTSAQAVQALAADETLTDTFTYTVSDGNGGESTATVSIVVTGADEASIVVIGTAGDDLLEGGFGNDILTGGGGDDTFIFAANLGTDVITDFEVHGGSASGDVIELHDQSVSDFASLIANASEVNGDSIINLDSGDAVTLEGVVLSQLSQDDFSFI